MKKGDWESPESWHVIHADGVVFMVSADVRAEVEAWMRGLKYPEDAFAIYTIDTIDGETVTLFAMKMGVIYDTEPESRFKTRVMNRYCVEERIAQGFPDPEE